MLKMQGEHVPQTHTVTYDEIGSKSPDAQGIYDPG